ncbi:permease IIC component [Lactococcus hodotermopsidis]|uniref:Permease IIC component n=1 Tax=Pseudolactococcus hodotermopsidis TaxID=2709157 RepID=A0A6A0BB36_9LACT|nr:PTS sugar transporter subunit IIC [Lactococcus hodotermopsidis]GFH42562.1 permease IIC component [Lactococcus hodotermopsidis]
MNEFINGKLIPAIMKFVSTKPMIAFRNGMLYTMPFSIIGSIFLLLANFPIPAVSTAIENAGLSGYFNQAFGATFAIMAFFAAMGITSCYVKEQGIDDTLPAGMIAMAQFLLLMSSEVTESESGNIVGNIINKDWTGGKGMIVAIIVGLFVGIIYSWFIKHDIRIKLPDGVPPNVANSFTALIPGVAITCLTLIVYIVFDKFNTTFFDWIYKVLQTPLQGMTSTLPGVIVMGVVIPLFWFFGIHGSTIVGGIMGPLLTANSLDNKELVEAGKTLTRANGGKIVTQQFLDQYMTVTGAGMTIGLVVFMVFFAKSKQYKELGKLSIIPGIFNINEPVIFATPIVMNPIMLLPFILSPLCSGLLTYFAIYTGVVPMFEGIVVPWTTPPIVSGFLTNGWQAAILQAICLTMTFFIYLPFAKKMDQITVAQEKGNVAN